MTHHNSKVILFGLTRIEYPPAIHYLEHCGGNVVLMVDNNPDFAGEFNGISVRPQSALSEYVDDPDILIVITTFRGHLEITRSLLDMGFNNDKITVALKDRDFYASYTSQFYRRKYNLDELVPIRANIELSREFNCRCIYCPMFGIKPAIKSETGFMSWDVVRAITEQIGSVPSITVGYFCGKGETFFHPEWFEIIKYIMENSYMRNLIFYSNGMLLNEETVHKLDQLDFESLWLEMSIDGETAEENNQYRKGSNYEKVKQNIDYAVKYFSGKNVTFQILNTHPVTEQYLNDNNHIVTTFLPTPEFIKKDFPDVLSGCRPTVMFDGSDGYEGHGITLRREVVGRRDIPYPCTSIFDEIDFNFLGDTVPCSCDLNSYNEPVSNVLKDNAVECWTNNDGLRFMRESFLNGNVPHACSQCAQAPIKELNIAVRAEKKMISFDYIRDCLNGRALVLYGMGKVCEACKASLAHSNIPIMAYTASSAGDTLTGKWGVGRVVSPDSLCPQNHFILIAAGIQCEAEIVPLLREKGFLLTKDYTSWSFAHNYPVDYVYYGVPVGKRSGNVSAFDTAIKGGHSEVAGIGRYCSINERAYIGGDHAQMISTSAYLYDEILCNQYRTSGEVMNRKVRIGNDVWIGACSFINSSKVRVIGDGAIIAAGAVVNSDVPPYAVVGGVPAKILKYRFNPQQIDILLRVKWWDRSDEWLYQHRKYLADMDRFFEYFRDRDD